MLLQPTADQSFLQETTARFLRDHVPPSKLRELHEDPAGFDPAYWKAGADLGWTSLLVPEARGGGSVSESGLVDLSLLAYEFGRHAAPGPLVTTNLVAAALSAAGAAPELVADLLAGTRVATWCLGESATATGIDDVALTITADGDGLVVDGTKRPVESAAQASHLLVCGRAGDGAGFTQVLVPADAPGLTIEPMRTVDLTRRFAIVRFDGVRVPTGGAAVGAAGDARAAIEHDLAVALVLGCSESVGAMQSAFDVTLEWAFDRYSFGRPLASYQALKHRFADMKTWLEASHAIVDEAVAALDAGAPDAAALVLVAAAYVGDRSTALLHECVQLHGGIGVTYEHDLHLFLRRVTLNRSLLGSPDRHRRRLGALVVERESQP